MVAPCGTERAHATDGRYATAHGAPGLSGSVRASLSDAKSIRHRCACGGVRNPVHATWHPTGQRG